MLRIYNSIDQLLRRNIDDSIADKRLAVVEIIKQVKENGDRALYQLTEQYDQVKLTDLRVSEQLINDFEDDDQCFKQALLEAAAKIREFHQKQKRESWFSLQEDGSLVGQLVTPIERVGVYVPGGTAAYPSSVLMNVIPAQVAGVNEIVMITPPNKDGSINPSILSAAKMLGIKEIYTIGGAQGVAALAYGTETIKSVDKLVGPGNIYVALAKKEVYGQVGIDMIAGPSEIAIIADEEANPVYIAADLLSQAEHDVLAQAVLVTTSSRLAEMVQQELTKQLNNLSRREIAWRSLKDYGGIVITSDLSEAFKEINKLAPEHLQLLLKDPFTHLAQIKNAGAIFLGEYSPEAVGDYFAGPNHVLPTNGTARFASPLNVDDFLKKSSVISYSRTGLLNNGEKIITIANKEGFTAHAQAIKVRLEGEKND